MSASLAAGKATSSDEEDVISLGGSPRPEQDSQAVSKTTNKQDETEDSKDPSADVEDLDASADPPKPSTSLDAITLMLERRTAKDTILGESFQDPSIPFYAVCPHTTRQKCTAASSNGETCTHAHFVVRQFPQTESSLGDCSYLNTCHRLDSCRYLHYEIETPTPEQAKRFKEERNAILQHKLADADKSRKDPLLPPQWLHCDLRKLDVTVLGKFAVIMADPPWDIHMTLPYGTMTDDEMKAMPLAQLQDDGGLLFLWVTGRATELGRECLKVWGYQALDEIVWIKTNQLGRLIRTGRTGHWLNHSKEHCIVAFKRPVQPAPTSTCVDGALTWANRGVDTDVIVSEVRETSRKPDEIYDLIERLAPGRKHRKLELFGRKHNARPGWITLGNQLGDNQIYDEAVVTSFNQRYTENPITLSTVPGATEAPPVAVAQ